MNYEFWKKAGIATGVIGTIAIAGTVLASDATPNSQINLDSEKFAGRPIMQKMHRAHMLINNEEEQNAITNRDYNAFVQAITPDDGTAPKILETITADNFGRFADMHEAIINKDFDTAKTIAEELGLPEMLHGEMRMPMHTPEEREAIHEAALSGDYQKWFDLAATDGELPEHLQVITPDNFARFSEMHQLMDDANQIREELGLERQNKGLGRGMGMGMRQGHMSR